MATKTFVNGTVLTAVDTNMYLVTTAHLISETVLGGASSTITFSSIPGTYQHLKLVARGRGSAAASTIDAKLTFNGDTGANYARLSWEATEAAPNPAGSWAGSQTAALSFIFSAASWAASSSGDGEILIPGYASAAHHKIGLMLGAAFNGASTEQIALRQRFFVWASTAAVTSITLTASSGNFAANTQVSLYGIG